MSSIRGRLLQNQQKNTEGSNDSNDSNNSVPDFGYENTTFKSARDNSTNRILGVNPEYTGLKGNKSKLLPKQSSNEKESNEKESNEKESKGGKKYKKNKTKKIIKQKAGFVYPKYNLMVPFRKKKNTQYSTSSNKITSKNSYRTKGKSTTRSSRR